MAEAALSNTPTAYLKALTNVAQASVNGLVVAVTRLPFRVGREDRVQKSVPESGERRNATSRPNNDLFLPGAFVSREHFTIEKTGDDYYLVDCGSLTGTFVDGKLVGGQRRGGRVLLCDGDVIMIDTYERGFIFQFATAESQSKPRVHTRELGLADEVRLLKEQIGNLIERLTDSGLLVERQKVSAAELLTKPD